MSSRAMPVQRLAPEVNRILFVKSLPFKITPDELYSIFGKCGAVRQIRLGSSPETRGRAFVVYEDVHQAKAALEALSGYNVQGRYIVVLYHTVKAASAAQRSAAASRADVARRAEAVATTRAQYNLDDKTDDTAATIKNDAVTLDWLLH